MFNYAERSGTAARLGFGGCAAKFCPCVHELAPLVEYVAAAIHSTLLPKT